MGIDISSKYKYLRQTMNEIIFIFIKVLKIIEFKLLKEKKTLESYHKKSIHNIKLTKIQKG